MNREEVLENFFMVKEAGEDGVRGLIIQKAKHDLKQTKLREID